MSDLSPEGTLSIALFSEIMTADQMIRSKIGRALPKGMELSHFSVLVHLAHVNGERTPAQLARTFHVTKGAMTNTLRKLETAGYVHIRPDWEDGRRKQISISDAGHKARTAALKEIEPIFAETIEYLGAEKMREVLPFLRDLRSAMSAEN